MTTFDTTPCKRCGCYGFHAIEAHCVNALKKQNEELNAAIDRHMRQKSDLQIAADERGRQMGIYADRLTEAKQEIERRNALIRDALPWLQCLPHEYKAILQRDNADLVSGMRAALSSSSREESEPVPGHQPGCDFWEGSGYCPCPGLYACGYEKCPGTHPTESGVCKAMFTGEESERD